MKKQAHIDRDRFAAALSSWMTDHHLTQREASERLGVSQAQVSSWVNADKTPSPASAARVLPIIGVSPADVRPVLQGDVNLADLAERIVLIPREGSVGASGSGRGGMMPLPDDDPDADPYPAEVLRRLLGYDPKGLVSAVIVGDSMYPRLRANDQVVYLPTVEFGDSGLYIFDLDGVRIIKTVQRLGGGAFRLIPANPEYDRETFTPCRESDTPNTYRSDLTTLTATLCVVGKVVWYPTLV